MTNPFNKETILSQPIRDENDLADVIVEMRKAIGFLLEENDALQKKLDNRVMSATEVAHRQAMMNRTVSPPMVHPPSTPWPGTWTDSSTHIKETRYNKGTVK